MKYLSIIFFLYLTLFMAGCDKTVEVDRGKTTNTLSSEFSSLEDKITFFKRYVRLDQLYKKLDFSVVYQDNSRGIPGPSDWDIRLVAIVPADELDQWVSGLKQFPQRPDIKWLSIIPTDIDYSLATDWYDMGFDSMVGINREKGLLVYRNVTH